MVNLAAPDKMASQWVKVFMIIPEFRILRLIFHRFSDYKSFSDKFTVDLKAISHLNMKTLKAYCKFYN